LTFGTNAAPTTAVVSVPAASTNLPAATTPAAVAGTNSDSADLAAAFRQLGANTNFIGQIRGQMFAGDPGGAAKYDQMVSGLLSGQMNLNDLRQQAQASAAQLRELKRELGPEADESLDGYLQVLDSFIAETANQPAAAAPAAQSP
jgi:predicted ATP-grasp superfamily ATP-dependent carboligase